MLQASRIILATLLLSFGGIAAAQNTGGTFGPVVNEGHESMQYRATYDVDSHGFAQRLHYQRAIDGERMFRVLAQTRKTADSDTDFDFVQAELTWQLTPDGQDWQTGLRFDARIRDDSRPGQLGVNWTNQWRLDDKWFARALLLTAVEVGNNASDSIAIQTRGHLGYNAGGGRGLGLQLFSTYGKLDDLRGFSQQGQQLGPYVELALGGGFSLYANALFGLTDATPDTQLRLWIGRSL